MRPPANNVYHQLNQCLLGKKEVTKNNKIQIYKTIFLPILTFGAETWIMLEKHESKVTASEMKFLRKIYYIII